MQLKNTPEKFGLIAKTFHWVLAIMILWLLSVGFAMVGIPPGPDKFWVYALHKSFGVLILILMIGRVLWRGISPRPAPLPTHKKWEDTLAKAVHVGLYVCVFAMPVSGWLMSSAGGFPAAFFGWPLPVLIEKNEAVFELTRNIHGVAAYGILALLALHFAGALKHHFIDKDATLQRMTTPKLGLWGGLLIAAVGGFLWTAPVAISLFGDDGSKAQEIENVPSESEDHSGKGEGGEEKIPDAHDSDAWQIDLANSSITFEATQYGSPFQGEFKDFGGKIIFDRSKLNEAYVDIWIDIGSITTGSGDRDDQAKSTEWFDAQSFPRAQFIADSFSETAPGNYIAHGALTIRDKASVVDLPFSLQVRESPEGQAALMEAAIDLDRLEFGIGQGQWQATDAIGGTVKIKIIVLATQE